MTNKKGKSFNCLLQHIHEQHGIEVIGSLDRGKLITMGYYHGYKGCRANLSGSNYLFDDFSQIVSVYNFDNDMKKLLFPLVMQFETLIKNIVINYSVLDIDPSFETVYVNKLTGYKEKSSHHSKNISRRLKLRQEFDGKIAYAYANNNKLIRHYIDKNKPVPLWALFEVLSLGNVANYVYCLNSVDKKLIAKFFNLYQKQYDCEAKIIQQSLFLIKDLRNALAHNHIIFDCRFQNSRYSVSANLRYTVKNKLFLSSLPNFNSLFDYLALLIIFLKEGGIEKRNLEASLFEFVDGVNRLYLATKHDSESRRLPLTFSVYNKIIGEDLSNKIEKLREYITSGYWQLVSAKLYLQQMWYRAIWCLCLKPRISLGFCYFKRFLLC